MKKIIPPIIFVSLVTASASHAADGTITVTGAVTANSCIINANVPNFTVPLGVVDTTALPAGATAGAKDFTINFTQCSAGIAAVDVVLDGMLDFNDTTSSTFKNVATTTPASGVGVRIYNNYLGNVAIIPPHTPSSTVPVVGNSASIPLTAKMYSTGTGAATATAGNLLSTINYTVQYQ